jgi:hypothetical protein
MKEFNFEEFKKFLLYNEKITIEEIKLCIEQVYQYLNS